MSVRQTDVHTAYAGMGTDYEPSQLPNNLAQEIVGFTPARRGIMRLAPLIKTFQRQYGQEINGTAIWLTNSGQADRLLIASRNKIYPIVLTSTWKYDERLDGQHSYMDLPVIPSAITVTGADTRYGFRGIQFAPTGELILAIGQTLGVGGGLLYRYYVSSDGLGTQYFYKLGVMRPGVPTLTETTGGGLTPSGTYGYVLTYVDELGRESSPSSEVTITLTPASPQHNGVIITRNLVGYDSGGGEATWNVYRRNPGSLTLNLVVEGVALDGGHTTYTDLIADTTVAAGRVAPSAGENDVAGQYVLASADTRGTADIMTVWKDRLAMNWFQQPNIVQVSNSGSPTQFSSLPLPINFTDGIQIGVGGHGQNQVTSLFRYGSLLGVCGRESTSLLYGDDITNFTLRQTLDRGSQNHDATQRCENIVMILSEDGVYTIQEGDGGTDMKLSLPIDNLFRGFASTNQIGNPASIGGQFSIQVINALLGNANSFYSQNRYFLSFANKTLCYDVQDGEWTDTGWGFLRTVSRYLSQMSSSSGSAPETIFVTTGDLTNFESILKYYTVVDTPQDFDAPSTFNSKIIYRPLLAGSDCTSHLKQPFQITQYGRTSKKRGTLIGSLKWFVDGRLIRTTPIYAYIVPNKSAAGALFVCSAPAIQGVVVWAEAEFTVTDLELNNAVFELGVLN